MSLIRFRPCLDELTARVVPTASSWDVPTLEEWQSPYYSQSITHTLNPSHTVPTNVIDTINPAIEYHNDALVTPYGGSQPVGQLQGSKPPIDWTKGIFVENDSWKFKDGSGNEITIHGAVYKFEIGKDANGQPIFINAWIPFGTGVVKAEYQYWCHGLTFGDMTGVNGLYSVYSGEDAAKVIFVFYKNIKDSDTKSGDIVVFLDQNGLPGHTAIISEPIFNADGTLDPTRTKVRTKNGSGVEQTMTLAQLYKVYPHLQPSIWTRK